MIQNPMFDYNLIDIIEDFNINKINKSLKRFKVNKAVTDKYVEDNINLGKTKATLVRVDFHRFMKKYKKYGLEGVYLKFKKANFDVSKDKIKDMVKTFEKLDKQYDHYLFFE